MPYYEYRCAANGRTVEVRHAMDALLTTWGEVAAAAGEEVGRTPVDAPVERLMSVAAMGHASAGGSGTAPAPAPFRGCGPGCGCAH